MRIVITGTPGTGKTTVAAQMAKMLGLKLILIKDIVEKDKIYTVENEEKIVDLEALAGLLKKMLKDEKNFVLEDHLACEIKIPTDYIFVLRTHPVELKKRLSARRYKPEKLKENLLCEMLDYCVQRVMKIYGRRPIEIDTTKEKARSTTLKIIKIIKNKKKKGDKVDYSKELLRYLRLLR